MAYTWEEPVGPVESSIRGVDLVPGERVEQLFVSDRGLVGAPPRKGHLLVMTSRRVLSFSQHNGRQETTLVPLDALVGVTVHREGRSIKSLYEGAALVLLGIVAYFLVGLFIVSTGSIAIPAAVGAIIIFAGGLLLARYFFWEREGSITFFAFRDDTWELSFNYRGSKAEQDSALLVNHFFRLQVKGSGDDGAAAPVDGGGSTGDPDEPLPPFW